MKPVTVNSPWALMIPRKTKSPKRYAMSLSNYRNAHHRANAEAKRYYSELMAPVVRKLPKYEGAVGLTLKMHPPTKRRYDLDNIGSVTAKFFQDTLVEHGVIGDDDASTVTRVTFVPGEIDRENPRVDIVITQEETND